MLNPLNENIKIPYKRAPETIAIIVFNSPVGLNQIMNRVIKAEAKNFLEKINDKRILIENMPKIGINDEKMIGYKPEQLKELMGKNFGLCLDLNHAIKAAISLKRDYKKYIKDFLKLNPKVFHISDGGLKNEKDEHLDIGKGEYDFNFLADRIKKKPN